MVASFDIDFASKLINKSLHPEPHPPVPIKGYYTIPEVKKLGIELEERAQAVCRIVWKETRDIDDGIGTGFLIAPDLLMTCHHVLPNQETAAKCQAEFYQLIEEQSQKDKVQRVIRVDLNVTRFVTSPNRKSEDTIQPVDEEHLDYTIIALEDPQKLAELSKKVFSLFEHKNPESSQEAHVIQYPKARKDGLRVALGSVKGRAGCEIHYHTDTDPGSSGGAVVDSKGRLIGLHYQAESDKASYRNKAINLRAIRKNLKKKGWKEKVKAYSTEAAAKKLQSALIFSLPELTQDFTGRESELKLLSNIFKNHSKVAITGLDGVGKTSLALKYAYERCSDNYFIYFIQASSSQLLIDGLLQLADELNIPLLEKEEERLQQLKRHLERLNRDYLLILDHVDKKEVFDAIEKYMPTQSKCQLITTRLTEYSYQQGFGRLEVRNWPVKNAIGYLLKTAHSSDETSARILAERLRCLPLALSHAAAYIRTRDIALSSYLKQLSLYDLKLFKEEHLDLNEDERTAHTTCKISLAAIEQQYKGSFAKELLAFFAFLSPTPVPLSLIKCWAEIRQRSLLQLGNSLRYLCNYSLIDSLSKQWYTAHVLVQKVTSYQFKQKEKNAFIREILKTFHYLLQPLDPELIGARKIMRSWIPHFEYLIAQPECIQITERSEFNQVLDRLWEYYYHNGNYQQSEAIAKKALKASQISSAGKTVQLANRLNQLGMSLSSLGMYEEALKYKMQSLELRKELLGEKHPDIAMSYKDIGASFEELGRYEEALKYKTQALELRKELLGEKHPDVAISYNDIGSSYECLGRNEEALKYKAQALELLKKRLGEKHPQIATSYNNIGSSYEDLGQHEKALKYQIQALELFKELLGEKHPDVASSYNNIGENLEELGWHEEALKYLTQALELNKELLGEKHPNVANSYNNIGESLRNLGHHEEALKYLRQALELNKELLGEKHPSIANSYNNIGLNLGNLGRHKEALKYLTQALELRKELLGEKNRDVANSYNNIGGSLGDLGRHEEEFKYLLQALELFKELLGEKHPDVATSYNNIGASLRSLKRYEEALKYLMQALELTKELLGEKNADIAIIYDNIGLNLRGLGRYEEALKYHMQALELFKELLDEKHPDVATNYSNIGKNLRKLGRHEEALKYLLQALEIRKELLGKKHPDVAASYNNLAKSLEDLGRQEEALKYRMQASQSLAEGKSVNFCVSTQ